MYFPLAAICALLAAVLAVATPIDESNGQRLARGLPPLAPKFGRNLPGTARGIDAASPVAAAKRSTPSSKATVSYSGRLQVRYCSSNYVVGVVKNEKGKNPICGVNTGPSSNDLHVSFTPGSDPFSITATSPNFPAPYYVGAAGSQTDKFGPSSEFSFTNVAWTDANSGPVNGVESSIWSFDTKTNQVTPQWINADNSKPSTQLWYDTNANNLFFAGEDAAKSNSFAVCVILVLVD